MDSKIHGRLFFTSQYVTDLFGHSWPMSLVLSTLLTAALFCLPPGATFREKQTEAILAIFRGIGLASYYVQYIS